MSEELLKQDTVDGICNICHNPLSLFGTKQLKDGVICRDCMELVSEWLSDDQLTKKSVSKMMEHLAYRKKNEEVIKGFTYDESVEGKYSVYINTKNRTFVVSKRKDYVKDNADVLSLDHVRSITAYTKRDEDHNYDIFVRIWLCHSPVRVVEFRVNSFSGMELNGEKFNETKDLAKKYLDLFEKVNTNGYKILTKGRM